MLSLSLALLLAAVMAWLAAERAAHARNLRAIPIRIHVNGTRGKSSVVRLVAGALRAHGLVVYAKVTGSLPRMLLPDASEVPVYRPGRANVSEQLRILAAAARGGADAVVIECMALQPSLQSLSELELVRATHGVVTNVGPDHLDVMGPEEDDVARALLGSCPAGGTLFTTESRHRERFESACRDRGSELVVVSREEAAAISDAEMERFSYVEHKENVALALRVTAALGVPRNTALRGMREAPPDVGALQEYALDFFGRRILFVNGFAANDPQSTRRIWELMLARHPWAARRVLVVNSRLDRPDRSRQLGEALPGWPRADRYLLIGSGTFALARSAVAHGLPPAALAPLEGVPVEAVFEEIVGACGDAGLVMGAGNIGGIGLELVKFFANRSRKGRTDARAARASGREALA
jgi:poly-gamma-glutamate synthase PgsB/CapB